MSLREKPSAATRSAELRKIRGQLERNKTQRTKLLDQRDRLISEAVKAGDVKTEIADAAGVERRSVYVIAEVGRAGFART